MEMSKLQKRAQRCVIESMTTQHLFRYVSLSVIKEHLTALRIQATRAVQSVVKIIVKTGIQMIQIIQMMVMIDASLHVVALPERIVLASRTYLKRNLSLSLVIRVMMALPA